MIEVKHLTKRYGNQTAVSDLSFSVKKGQIYGFLGPNGAGKSTTMNIMTGCLSASQGEVKIGGYDIFEDSAYAKRLIGYLPEQPPLYLDRTPREYLTFVGMAKGIAKSDLKKEIENAMKVTQITDVADRLIKNLSKGYKQRVGIAQAILGNPEVIILDEPTVGLDPIQIIEIRELIQNLGKNHTVILSSHILSEVQAVCQTIMIISKGKLVACDTPENLEQLFAGKTTVELICETSRDNAVSILSSVSSDFDYEVKESNENRCDITINSSCDQTDDICRELFMAFAKANKPILQMNSVKASLEDIFIELTAEDIKNQSLTDTENELQNDAEYNKKSEIQDNAGRNEEREVTDYESNIKA